MSIVPSISAPTISKHIGNLVESEIVKCVTRSQMRLFYLAISDAEVLLKMILEYLGLAARSKYSAISKTGFDILKKLYECDTAMSIREIMDEYDYGAYMTWHRHISMLEEAGLVTLVLKRKRAAYRISEQGIEVFKSMNVDELQVTVEDTISLDSIDIDALRFMESNDIDSMCNSLSANKISKGINTTQPTMLRHMGKLLKAGYVAQGLSGSGKAYYITDLGKKVLVDFN